MTTALKTTVFARLAVIIFYTVLAFLLIKPLFAQDSTNSAASSKKDTIKQRLEERKEKIENRIGTRKEKVETGIASREAKIASGHAVLKEKLQAFKDKRKAEIAERVNINLNRISQKQTEQMLKHLEKMSEILNKLENLVNQGNPSIKDINVTRTAIADAKAFLSSIRETVQEQVANDYTIQLTSESKVKADAQTQRTKLHNDLVTVRKQVIESKQKVMEVIKIAKSGKDTREATTSGQ